MKIESNVKFQVSISIFSKDTKVVPEPSDTGLFDHPIV